MFLFASFAGVIAANSGDVLTYDLDVAPVGATIDSDTGLIQWTPDYDQDGPNDFTVSATDNGLPHLTDTQSFVVDVGNINDYPVFTSAPVTTGTEGVQYSYDVDAIDTNPGQVVTLALDLAPVGVTFDALTGLILQQNLPTAMPGRS